MSNNYYDDAAGDWVTDSSRYEAIVAQPRFADLFVHTHAAAFIDQIVAELQHNVRLREAVLEVNIDKGYLPSEIEARIAAAFGPRFRFLDTPAREES